MSPNDSYPQHVVTAVIVAHDGAAWLPHVIDALLEQTRPVQRVVAVDTGSRDRSGAVLSGKLGQTVVFGMERGTGYGAAVTRALRHKAANTSVPGAAPPRSERSEWVWLLHDDCEPAPDALEQLLRGAAETRSAAVLGPKVKDWADREVILEAGLTIDTVGRRITGIEPREVDQGQHDGDRDALAVSSAGMLIRRDVWDEVGGFDAGMALFMEDVDFCWRVHAAGYRVRVITDAVVYHAQAAARNRRPISVSRRPRLLERRNALATLLGNLPAWPMLVSLAGNVTVSVLRTIFFLVAKRPAAAMDELGAVASVLGHPVRLLRMRHRRSRGRRPAYGRVRADLPPGRSVRRIAEFVAAASSRSAQVDTAGSHHATEDPSEDDFLLTDSGLAQRILTSPGVLLFVGLTVIAIVAEHSLIGAGPLGGGGLVPAWGGASGLWGQYLQGFHPSGIGSGSSAPPYLAVIAALATLLGGKPWLAVDVILLGSIPLAGICAFQATRRITRLVLVRVWAAATYALLPVATGAIAAGRIGTAAVFVLIPLIALQAGRMLSQPPRSARRAAWATGLAVAVGTAFVPLLWPLALIAAAVAALALRSTRPGMLRNLATVVLVPPLLLLPWSIQIAAHPALALLEAGVQQAGLASTALSARSLLLLSPGGPGLPPVWVTAGLILAALAALMASRRRVLVLTGWGVALSGLLAAIAVSRASVTPVAGGSAVPGWPGPELAIVAAGLLLAACAAGDSLAHLAAARSKGLRRMASPRAALVALLALVACSAPLLAAASWVLTGVTGPVTPAAGQTVPEFVSVSAGNGLQQRTLVLSAAGSRVSYSLLRGSSPSMADPDLIPAPAAQQALSAAVTTLVAPGGGGVVDQSQSLAHFDIGFVLLRAPVNLALAHILDGVPGMRRVSTTSAFVLWRLTSPPARVQVVEPDGTVVPVSSGPVGVSGASAPAAGGILELAEPAGGWRATLNGRALVSVASPAGSWAQAFRLPPGGGTLGIGRGELGHDVIIVLEALAVAVVAALGLPGIRTAAEGQPEAAGSAGAVPEIADEEEASQPLPQRRARGRVGAGAGGRGGRSAGRPGKDREGTPGLRRKRPAAAPQRTAAMAPRGVAEPAAALSGLAPGPPAAWPYDQQAAAGPEALQPSAGARRYAAGPGAQDPFGQQPYPAGRDADDPRPDDRQPQQPYLSERYADEPRPDDRQPQRPYLSERYADEPRPDDRQPQQPYLSERYADEPRPDDRYPQPYPAEPYAQPRSAQEPAGRRPYPPQPPAPEPYPQPYDQQPYDRQPPADAPYPQRPYEQQPYAPEPRTEQPANLTLARQSPSGTWPPPQQQPAGWPAADQGEGWQTGADQSGWSSGTQSAGWSSEPAAGWPSAEPAAGWPSEPAGSWPSSEPAAGRPSAGPGAGRPPAGPQPDWASGDGDVLEPLPPAEMRPGTHRPEPDEQAAPRWPAPDYDNEGEGW